MRGAVLTACHPHTQAKKKGYNLATKLKVAVQKTVVETPEPELEPKAQLAAGGAGLPTALWQAARHGNASDTEILLVSADGPKTLEQKDDGGRAPLFIASSQFKLGAKITLKVTLATGLQLLHPVLLQLLAANAPRAFAVRRWCAVQRDDPRGRPGHAPGDGQVRRRRRVGGAVTTPYSCCNPYEYFPLQL